MREASPRCNAPFQRRLSLRLKSKFDARSERIIRQVAKGLPELSGGPICLSARPHLKAHGGKLLSGEMEPGTPVHAASFIRKRKIVLETQLLTHPQKLRLIVAHEVFHFVWARLGNVRRAEYAALIRAERKAHAHGELGESANCWKDNGTKNYVCESFCDTAASLYSGVKSSAEFTLAARWRRVRQAWFQATFANEQKNRC